MQKNIKIGPYQLNNNLVLAPMAGVTDLPFRQLCRRMGAGLAVSEMIAANPELRHTRKSKLRMNHLGEEAPISVQIAGSDPATMAIAAEYNVGRGAQIIDINMGCPAKKVCQKAAGSALLRDEGLVKDILRAVVDAVNVPVTLKIRTGWNTEHRNGVTVARIAEDCGIQALAVHGRTRACKFKGRAEYDTIAAIKNSVSIPVLANGDITTPVQAQQVLDYTQADGLLIGRAAQGNPWLFKEINHYLNTGKHFPPVSLQDIQQTMTDHVSALHDFYGEEQGLRVARKHVGWYLSKQPSATIFKRLFNQIDDASQQLIALHQLSSQLTSKGDEIAA